MNTPPIMKTILCPETLPEITKLYTANFASSIVRGSLVVRYDWAQSRKTQSGKKQWCCLPCTCASRQERSSAHVYITLRPFNYPSQFDLYYRVQLRTPIRIHMPWTVLDTTLAILLADPKSIQTFTRTLGTSCLTLRSGRRPVV